MKTHTRGVRRLSAMIAFAVMVVGVCPLRSEETKPPFRIASGLFDSANLKTLGLQQTKGTHTLLYKAADDKHKFCHHPNLAVFQDRLYCMWSNGLVDEDAPGQRVLYSQSDDGVSWSKPAMLTDHLQGKGICVAAGFHVAADKLVAYYTATGGQNFHPKTSLMARTSSNGRTWSPPRQIASGFFIEGPRQLESGRLLLAGECVGEAREKQRMQFLYTDDRDGLAGWQVASIEPPELKLFGYTEPSFYSRRHGTIVATLRNYSGYLHASASADNGQTWTPAKQTDFPDSTARTSAGNLPNGMAYIINNAMPKQFDRSLLTIALSQDGVLFDRAYLLRGEPTKRRYDGKHKLDGWQYPNAIEWKDTLYVAYSINKEDVSLTRIALKDLSL